MCVIELYVNERFKELYYYVNKNRENKWDIM